MCAEKGREKQHIEEWDIAAFGFFLFIVTIVG